MGNRCSPAIRAIADDDERRRVVQSYADRNDINVFQGQQFQQDDRGITHCILFPSPRVPDGTAVEFYAEKDLYTVISNCPYADQALPFPEAEPNRVYISVWDTGIAPCSDNHLGLPGENFWVDTVDDRISRKRQDATLDQPTAS